MALTQLDKHKLFGLLTEWDSHSVYNPEVIATELADCGFEIRVSDDKATLHIEGSPITVITPEWGRPGISPLSIIRTIYELTVGVQPVSSMFGRGFWYRDVTRQIAQQWGIKYDDD
jgi:hypothetical protein